jgi:thymidylate kinase
VLVTFSGYNASGKTTAIRDVQARLTAEGVPCRIVRFFSLDISAVLRPRPPKPGQVDAESVPSVRASERQPGPASKKFRWIHFAKMLMMATQVQMLRVVGRHKVLLCSQYFYDNFVHFVPRGFWYKLATLTTPRATAAYLLTVDRDEYERRFIERLERRHGVRLERLPDSDRHDLEQVLTRYQAVAEEFPYLRVVRASERSDLDRLWSDVRPLVHATPAWRARTAGSSVSERI